MAFRSLLLRFGPSWLTSRTRTVILINLRGLTEVILDFVLLLDHDDSALLIELRDLADVMFILDVMLVLDNDGMVLLLDMFWNLVGTICSQQVVNLNRHYLVVQTDAASGKCLNLGIGS